jgi:Transcriptional regulator, AbiEi antitoxin/Protein of unknown function (DUF559)
MGDKRSPRPNDGLGHVVAEIAEGQHGVAARRQLFAAGLSKAEVNGLVERGHLLCLHRGVYAVGHARIDKYSRWMSAVLASGPEAVLSHRSAAQLWGVVPEWDIHPEVIRPRKSKTRTGVNHHRIVLPSDEVDVVLGIPVTSIFRTLFDMARLVSVREMHPRQLQRAFHEAEAKGLTGRVSLPGLIERYPGHRGVGVLRKLLGQGEPIGITESELEERFLAFLGARGFPRPRLSATLPLRGRLLRPDCLWERERLIVELDGREVHGSDRAFEGDRRRDRELLAEGWRSLRITWRQLRDEPDAIASDLMRLLGTPA